jgi:hypothetical protein
VHASPILGLKIAYLVSNPPSCAKLGAVVSPTTVLKQPVVLNSQSRVRIQTKRYNRTKQNRIEQKRERERERERGRGTSKQHTNSSNQMFARI